MHFLKVTLLVALCVAVLLPLSFWIVNGQAFRQKPNQVAIRNPGNRLLGKPQLAKSEAAGHLEYAWMSESVYGPVWMAKQKSKGSASCQEPDVALANAGWKILEGIVDKPTQDLLDSYHLRVKFWTNADRKSIAVAFGGTDPSSKYDWISNFRWFIPKKNDEYTLTSKVVAKTFSEKIIGMREGPNGEFFRAANIYVTGHSLGAGLAQQFTYSLPIGGPKVSEVYAFDPSPITGYSGVDVGVRQANMAGLKIDRIYERGEMLAILRSLTNIIDPPAVVNPEIRQVRYNLFWTPNPVAGHSIGELACQLDIVSHS